MPAGHLRVLARGRQEAPGDGNQRPQDGEGRVGPPEGGRPPLRHVRPHQLGGHRAGDAHLSRGKLHGMNS